MGQQAEPFGRRPLNGEAVSFLAPTERRRRHDNLAGLAVETRAHPTAIQANERAPVIETPSTVSALTSKSESLSPQENFWDWVFAVCLHADPKRRARLEGWKPTAVHKFNFLYMASAMAKVYYAFMGIVRDVLAEPELVPD